MRTALLLATVLLGGCTQLFLHPTRAQALHPGPLGLAYEDVFLPIGAKERLHGWFLPAKAARGTILHLHGNGQNITSFISLVHWLPARGYNVLLLDYRGYGRSDGVATIADVHVDAQVALQYLAGRTGPGSERVIILGQSLGGSVGIYAAAHAAPRERERIKGVVSEGAFSSYSRIAREKMNALWVTWPLQWPLSLLFSDTYSAEDALPLLGAIPLLLVHGDRDAVVPHSHSQRLHDRAQGRRELWTIAGGEHIDALARPEWRERLVTWLDGL
jgi:fermentation-respiration switch protein FrsA (DUF1100 family)